jgi:hypothetical protein
MAARPSLNARVASNQDSTHKAAFYTRGDGLRERRFDELTLREFGWCPDDPTDLTTLRRSASVARHIVGEADNTGRDK